MALLNFFKKPKKDHKLRPTKKTASESKRAVSDRRAGASEKHKSKQRKGKSAKKNVGSIKLKESKIAWRVLVEPHVTEKSSDLVSLNQYTFRILNEVNKGDIKSAIEEVYGVHVTKVRKISIPRKQRRRSTGRRKQMGWRAGYNKAIVTLKEGDKIEVLPH